MRTAQRSSYVARISRHVNTTKPKTQLEWGQTVRRLERLPNGLRSRSVASLRWWGRGFWRGNNISVRTQVLPGYFCQRVFLFMYDVCLFVGLYVWLLVPLTVCLFSSLSFSLHRLPGWSGGSVFSSSIGSSDLTKGQDTLGSSKKLPFVGRVVKASASRAEDPGFESRLRRDFFGVESYQ